jgi:tetratricopeptide (TPR) repeat protein
VTALRAHRQPNDALRAARIALRLSQREFAALVRKTGDELGDPNNCTKRLVQRWESGAYTTCRPHYRRALQAATRTPYGRLGFKDEWSAAATESASSSGGFNGTPVANPSDHFRYALSAPTQADTATLAVVQTTVAQLFDLEHHTLARMLLPTVSGQVDDLAGLLRGAADSDVREWLVVHGGQAAALAGWLALDCGDAAGAHRYWDGAMAAARATADGPLLACVLTYLSCAAMESGDYNAAWQLAHTATQHAGEESRAQAWMNVRAGMAVARLGDVCSAEASLKLMREWIPDVGPPPAPSDEAPPWLRFIDRAYLWALAGNVSTCIGDHDGAHEAASKALDLLSGNRTKTRAIILAEAAYAFAYIGGTERAMQLAMDAIELTGALEVTAARRRLQELVRLLPKPLHRTGRELARRVTGEWSTARRSG